MVAKYHGPNAFLVLFFWSEKNFKKYLQKTRIFFKTSIIGFRRSFQPTQRVKTSIKCFFDVPRHCTWSVCKEKFTSAKSIFFDFCPDISLHRLQCSGPQTATSGSQTAPSRPQTAPSGSQTAQSGPQSAPCRPQTTHSGPQTAHSDPQTARSEPQTAHSEPQTSQWALDC